MKTRKLVYNAILIAIILVLSLVPNIGFIHVGPVSITIVHIPIIIAAVVFGVRSSTIAGLAFGIGSWIAAIQTAASPVDLLFTNPLVAIVPRILFGLAAGLLWQLLKTNLKDGSYLVRVGIVSLLSSFIHTFFVLLTLYIAIYSGTDVTIKALISNGFFVFMASIVAVNTFVEAGVAMVITVPVARALAQLKLN